MEKEERKKRYTLTVHIRELSPVALLHSSHNEEEESAHCKLGERPLPPLPLLPHNNKGKHNSQWLAALANSTQSSHDDFEVIVGRPFVAAAATAAVASASSSFYS